MAVYVERVLGNLEEVCMAVGDGAQETVFELLGTPGPGELGTLAGKGPRLDSGDDRIRVEDHEVIEGDGLEAGRGRFRRERLDARRGCQDQWKETVVSGEPAHVLLPQTLAVNMQSGCHRAHRGGGRHQESSHYGPA